MFYIYGMAMIDFSVPRAILQELKGKTEDFYLAGGTALSMVYFHHRESSDVDLFTKNFSPAGIQRIIDLLRENGFEIEQTGSQLENSSAKMLMYATRSKEGAICKLDFVEDLFDLLRPLQEYNGIQVLSIEDIYLRKIAAAAGYVATKSSIGRDMIIGGRQEAKDVYDLYCLSTMSQPLSEFVLTHGNNTMTEAVIRWHQTYDRLRLKTGLLDLITPGDIDTRTIETHFNHEAERLLQSIL